MNNPPLIFKYGGGTNTVALACLLLAGLGRLDLSADDRGAVDGLVACLIAEVSD